MTENFTGNQWNSSSLPDSHLIDCHLAKINISQIRQSVLCGNTRECCVVVILSLVNKHGDDKLNIVPASADRQPPFIIHIEAGVSGGQWREHDPDNGDWLASQAQVTKQWWMPPRCSQAATFPTQLPENLHWPNNRCSIWVRHPTKRSRHCRFLIVMDGCNFLVIVQS